MREPDFFVLGAAKSGTTTLYHLLKQHPEIFLPRNKEPSFFGIDRNYRQGRDHYLATHFGGAAGYRAVGEATPYLHRPEIVAPRMVETLAEPGEIRFVVLLRDPVDRAWSHYLHLRRVSAESRSFDQAIADELDGDSVGGPRGVRYVDDGRYGGLLTTWFEHFDADRFAIFTYESFYAEVARSVERVFRHLGVHSDVEVDERTEVNAAAAPKSAALMRLMQNPPGAVKWLSSLLDVDERMLAMRRRVRQLNTRPVTRPELDESLRHRLSEVYGPDIARLARLTGLDVSKWTVPR